MKNLILIFISIICFNAQAQKTFRIFNYTSSILTIDNLVTRTSTFQLPAYNSKPSQGITIAPYGSYTLLNTTNLTRFPFYSPAASGGSLPLINNWERQSTAGLPGTIVASTAAWILGGAQVFYWIQITLGNSTKQIGVTGSPGVPGPSTSNGWTASYNLTGTTAAPVYTITVQ